PSSGCADGFALVDMNGDGHLDLVMDDPCNASVDVYLGNGDGTFAAPVSTSTGNHGLGVTTVIAADLNGDGHPDVVLPHHDDGSVAVLLGPASGALQAQPESTCVSEPIDVAVGDVDGDHVLDLAVAGIGDCSDMVALLRGLGDGTFAAPETLLVGGYPRS